ncbi:hypothetical protein TNCV_2524511 [Trichonephila clavipes]|nr:hypothetical protein TNCV_2524511 [Trichonephila clavipes]
MASLPQLLLCKRFSTLKQMLHSLRNWDKTNPSVLYLELDLAWCCSMVDGHVRGFGCKDQWVGRSRLEYRDFSLDVGSEHGEKVGLVTVLLRHYWVNQNNG